VSHRRMIDDAAELKKLLSQSGVKFATNSVLADAIAAAECLPGWSRDAALLPHDLRAPEVIRRLTGLSYIARSLFHARKNRCFPSLNRWLSRLGEDNPLPTEPLPSANSARNFVFELEVACHFMAKGFEVKTGVEPDVVLQRDGTWNFACKMVSSEKSNSVGELLSKGWRQVLDSRHPCNYGMVIMGLGQRLNHSEFLPVLDDAQDIWGAFLNAEVPKRMLLNRIERLTGQILSQARTVIDDRDARFRGVVVIAHTLSGYCRGPMLLTATRLITRNDLFKSPAIIGPEEELIRQFNDAAQVVFTA